MDLELGHLFFCHLWILQDVYLQVDYMDLNVQIPREHLLGVVLIMFLLGGFVIGYLVGNYTMYKRWDEYNKLWQQKVLDECVCVEKNESTMRWNYGFNESFI